MKKLIVFLLLAIPVCYAQGGKRVKAQVVNPVVEVEESLSLQQDTLDTENLDDIDAMNEQAEERMQFYFRDDTLFFTGAMESLPLRFVIAGSDGAALYKQLPNDTTGADYGTHPASDMYGDIWTSARVNPYQIKVDSMRDSVLISTAGYVAPLTHAAVVTSPFGPRRYRYHYGTDLRIAIGDSIRSIWDGQVRIVGWDPRGYGHYVVIRHDNGLETVYGHLSQPLFDENERIFAGETLGLGGNTGRSTGPHLHFEIRYLGNAINPELIVDFANAKLKDPSETYLITKKGTYYHLASTSSTGNATYSGQQYHKVRNGDTLSGIAKKYHTSVKAILNLNPKLKKNPDKLSLGQQIRVR